MPTLSRSGYFTGLPTASGRASFGIAIDVQGDAQIEMHFKRISERSLDLKPAWFAIREEMLLIEKRQFQSQGEYRSGGWAPLAEATVSRRERLGLGTRILIETGRLMRSLTDTGGKDQKFVPMRSWMLFGSNVPYLEAHMKGDPDRSMPARPPIAFNEIDREKFLRIIRGWIMAGMPTETAATGRERGSRMSQTLSGDWEGSGPSRFSQTLKGDWEGPSGSFKSKSPTKGLIARPGGRGWVTESEFNAWLRERGLSE